MSDATDRRGRTYERRRRPLSNTSIDAMIKLLGQILQQAVDYELIPRNPVRVGERGQRFLPRVKPLRSFLEIDEFQALLDAVGDLDRTGESDVGGQVRALNARGLTVTQIADELNRTAQTVYYHVARSEPRQLGGRRAIIAALGLGGFHISDSCARDGAYPERMKVFVRRWRRSARLAAISSAVLVDVGSTWCQRARISVGRESLGHRELLP